MDNADIERLTAMGATEEDLQNPEKVKEFAEKIEAENKANEAKDEVEGKDDKVLTDQLGRLRKALSKGAKTEAKADVHSEAPSQTLSELDVDNRVFARSEKITDKQLEILKEYAKLPRNEGKSFEDIAKSSAVKAEFKDLQSELDTANELDANADDERLLSTKNEIHEKYSKSGETPNTEYEHKTVVEKDLENLDTQGI